MSSWGVRQSAGYRHITGLRSKSKCRFEGPKVALRRHSTGTTRSPHDLVIDAEKIHFLTWRRLRRLRFRWSAGDRRMPLPDFGQSRSAGLSPPKWHFAGTRPARHDPRTISQMMQKRFAFDPDAEKIHFLNLAPGGGYASGGVPVTGTLPELGQSRSAGLRPPKWHFAGTWAARHDPRTIS